MPSETRERRRLLLQHETKPVPVEAAKLPAFLLAIEVYQGPAVTKLALKIMALTFVRPAELVGARWTEFNLKEHRWNIPPERTRGKKPHIVPLSTQAVEALVLLRTGTGHGEFLFPEDRDSTMRNIRIALKRMGITGHGFRALGSTLLREQRWPSEHIALQFGHAPLNPGPFISPATSHALYLEPRAKMMQAWADFLGKTQREAGRFPSRVMKSLSREPDRLADPST